LKKYTGIFRELRLMTTQLPAWRFIALWLLALLMYVIGWW